jgi:hypothetical protein
MVPASIFCWAMVADSGASAAARLRGSDPLFFRCSPLRQRTLIHVPSLIGAAAGPTTF